MLATRISFMNDIANLCELGGCRRQHGPRRGIGSDRRIGTKFSIRLRIRRLVFPQGRQGSDSHRARTRLRNARYQRRRGSHEAQKSPAFEKLVPRIGPTCGGSASALGGALHSSRRRTTMREAHVARADRPADPGRGRSRVSTRGDGRMTPPHRRTGSARQRDGTKPRSTPTR